MSRKILFLILLVFSSSDALAKIRLHCAPETLKYAQELNSSDSININTVQGLKKKPSGWWALDLDSSAKPKINNILFMATCFSVIGKIPIFEVYDRIVIGDYDTLKKSLGIYAENNNSSLLVLNSFGGDVAEAIKIGRMLQGHLSVSFANKECISACVIILAGSAVRLISGGVGVHSPRFDYQTFSRLDPAHARSAYNQMISDVKQYYLQAGISEQFTNVMQNTPSSSVRFMTAEELDQVGFSVLDPAYREYLNARIFSQCGPSSVAIFRTFVSSLVRCDQSDLQCRSNSLRTFQEGLRDLGCSPY